MKSITFDSALALFNSLFFKIEKLYFSSTSPLIKREVASWIFLDYDEKKICPQGRKEDLWP